MSKPKGWRGLYQDDDGEFGWVSPGGLFDMVFFVSLGQSYASVGPPFSSTTAEILSRAKWPGRKRYNQPNGVPGFSHGTLMQYTRTLPSGVEADAQKESEYAYRYIYCNMAAAFQHESVADLRKVFSWPIWNLARDEYEFFLGFLEAHPKSLPKFSQALPEVTAKLLPKFSGNLAVIADKMMDRGLIRVNPGRGGDKAAKAILTGFGGGDLDEGFLGSVADFKAESRRIRRREEAAQRRRHAMGRKDPRDREEFLARIDSNPKK